MLARQNGAEIVRKKVQKGATTCNNMQTHAKSDGTRGSAGIEDGSAARLLALEVASPSKTLSFVELTGSG